MACVAMPPNAWQGLLEPFSSVHLDIHMHISFPLVPSDSALQHRAALQSRHLAAGRAFGERRYRLSQSLNSFSNLPIMTKVLLLSDLNSY